MSRAGHRVVLASHRPVRGSRAERAPRTFRRRRITDMPAKLASCRAAHGLAARASLDDARAADPAGWAALESDLIAVVIGMPLARLQRFGEGRRSVEDRFIYDFSWPEEVGRAAVARASGDRFRDLGTSLRQLLVVMIRLLLRCFTAVRHQRSPD